MANTGLYRRAGQGAKLTDDQVIDILRALDRGVRGKDLADKYGVSQATISKIKKGDLYVWAKEGGRGVVQIGPLYDWEQDKLDELRQMFCVELRTVVDIADHFGVEKNVIMYLKRWHGLKRPEGVTPQRLGAKTKMYQFDEAQRADIVKRNKRGDGMKAIGKRYYCSEIVIKRILQEEGVL